MDSNNLKKTIIAVGLNTNDTIQGDDDDSTEDGGDNGDALDDAGDALSNWMTDPNDPETQDRLMDEFQDLLEWQQDQIAAAEAKHDAATVAGIAQCSTFLKESQAAAKKKDAVSAKRLLTEYQGCMRKLKLPELGQTKGPSGGKAAKGGSGKLIQR
jgi:hypothetical protein